MKQLQLLTKGFYYGNFFYAFCTIALCYQTFLFQNILSVDIWFYVFVFSATIIFYSKPYILGAKCNGNSERLIWYRNNKIFVQYAMYFFYFLLFVSSILILYLHFKIFFKLSFWDWFIILFIPLITFSYYGYKKNNLRNIGWLKPFVIGFAWAGLVTIYPIIYSYDFVNSKTLISSSNLYLFFNNFLFISILCILFDIKDYEKDATLNVNTFMVLFGLQKTIFAIAIPLTILLMSSYFIFSIFNNLSITRIIFNSITYFLLLIVCNSFKKPKSLMYYLVVVDGLIFVKAFLEIITFKMK